MKILPINLYNGSTSYNRADSVQKKSDLPNLRVLNSDTVSFKARGLDPRASALKSLLYYKIPDLYSEIILLPSESLQAILDKEIFSPRLKDVVRLLKPYQTSLFSVDKQFYEMLKKQAQKTPNMPINGYIKQLVPEYNTSLYKTQQEVFQNLSSYASGFPADLLEQYNYLLYRTNEKLQNKPIFIPFSAKEFKHKLQNIAKRIGCSGESEESRVINQLISIAGTLPVIPKEQRLNPKFKLKKYEDKQKIMIAKFRKTLENSVLKRDKDLKELLRTSEDRIYKRATKIPFNRKSFIYDIQKITERLEDLQLARLVEREAVSLPTSKQDLSAFILKEAERSDEQIVFDMLSGSVGSIDHLLSLKKGGKNFLYNYGLSSSYMNSEKAHSSFSTFLLKDPQIAKYVQRQINTLISLANSGVFDKINLDKFYILNLAKTLEKLSSKNNPLNINTDKLLY